MTLNGAIMQLVELSEHPMMPVIFRPAIQKVIETISELENNPELHWIPVTEEPKESGEYLVTAIISFVPDHVDDPNTYEAVTTAYYSADTRYPIKWCGNNVEKVLAWMPLPEPYKGVADDRF